MAKEKEKGVGLTRGERLRRLRKAKGLSLEEVHQKTKIHIRILKALEEDRAIEISPAYIKGLLKIYCNILGVDPVDFIQEYSKAKIEPPKEEVFDSSKIEEKPPLVKPHISLSMIKKKIKIKPIIFVICLLVLAILTFKLGKKVSTYRASRLKQSSPTQPVTKPEVSSPAPIISKPSLGIRAKENCWLEVKTDDRTIFKGILEKGNFEYWEAKEQIQFSLGNAGGVEVEVNGQRLPSLGRRRQVIKNIKITKSGLRAPK